MVSWVAFQSLAEIHLAGFIVLETIFSSLAPPLINFSGSLLTDYVEFTAFNKTLSQHILDNL